MDAYLKDQFADFTGVKAALPEQNILVILRDTSQIFLVKYMGVVAGGGREVCKKPLECLQREVWEELGLTLTEESIIWSKIYPSILDKDSISCLLWLAELAKQYREIRLVTRGRNLTNACRGFIKAEGCERFKDYLSERKK